MSMLWMPEKWLCRERRASIFSQVERLKEYRLDVPQITLLAYELKKAGLDIPDGILTREELTEALEKLCQS